MQRECPRRSGRYSTSQISLSSEGFCNRTSRGAYSPTEAPLRNAAEDHVPAASPDLHHNSQECICPSWGVGWETVCVLFGGGRGFLLFVFSCPNISQIPDHTIGLFFRPTFHLKQGMLMPTLSVSQNFAHLR